MYASRSSHSMSIKHLVHGSVQNAFDDAREIGYFSVDSRKQIHFDRSLMRFYVPRSKRNQSFDLNAGYEGTQAVELYDSGERMNNLLRWIAHKRFEPLKSESVHFVSLRGTIQKLLCTPYCKGPYDYWIICACRVDDVIYLQSIPTDQAIEGEINATEKEKRMSAWGYKFEQYMTADGPHGVISTSSTTYSQEEFCVVASNKIGEHKLLIRAEVDGVNSSIYAYCDRGDTSCYVEMKTSKIVPEFTSSHLFKKYKSLKWWAQSTIMGIKENICGLRDDNGIVQTIQNFQTDNLPVLGAKFWSPEDCFNFCNNFLNYLKEVLVQNDHRIVYKFQYNGGNSMHISKLVEPIPRYQVIQDWYLSEMWKHEQHLK